MRRVLVLLTVAALAFIAGLPQTSPTQAASYDVTARVYHPTGIDEWNKAKLTCGWHETCDGFFGDSDKKALDWVYAYGSNTTVWVRIKALTDSSSDVWVARLKTKLPDTGCKRVVARILRISDWERFGSVVSQHTQAPSSYYANISANSGWRKNSAVVGSFLDPAEDNCYTTGKHTHQHYLSGPYDITYWKNPQFPNEKQCYHCGMERSIWQWGEYTFTFES